MRLFFSLTLLAVLVATGSAQAYQPKAGETDLKLQIENRGTVFIRLFVGKAPKTTGFIIKLVTQGFYNGLRFHRVETDPKPYLIQIGDPATKNNMKGPTVGAGGVEAALPFEDSGRQNVTGAVGLARPTSGNASTSQFYILLGPSRFLDGHYTVFGQVVKGMSVVKKVVRGDRVVTASIVRG